MVCDPDRARHATIGAMLLALAGLAALMTLPGSALGAVLIGGREQAAVANAFSRLAADRDQLIVSIRASTVSPGWAMVRSVRPERTDRTSAGHATVKLRSTYFRRVGTGERRGNPPAAVRSDLDRDLRVAVVYSGAGSEKLSYQQTYRSVCDGAGGFVEQQQATVSPMSWSVQYVVDLDRLQAAVAGAQGPAIVPTISFVPSASHLQATEVLSRSSVDQGCSSHPTTYRCVTSFQLVNPGAGPELSLHPGAGTEIGIPMRSAPRGQCSADDYTVGPSLWDSGASTVIVPRLGLLGGALPARPYAPVRVSWPGNSALEQQGFLTSPCQGISSTCSDQLSWHGTVRLQPASTG